VGAMVELCPPQRRPHPLRHAGAGVDAAAAERALRRAAELQAEARACRERLEVLRQQLEACRMRAARSGGSGTQG